MLPNRQSVTKRVLFISPLHACLTSRWHVRKTPLGPPPSLSFISGGFHMRRPQFFLICGPPPPLSRTEISWFCSFRLLFGDPLPLPVRTSYMEAPLAAKSFLVHLLKFAAFAICRSLRPLKRNHRRIRHCTRLLIRANFTLTDTMSTHKIMKRFCCMFRCCLGQVGYRNLWKNLSYHSLPFSLVTAVSV